MRRLTAARRRYFGIGWRWWGFWFSFFSLQGPLCLAETALSRRRVSLPRPLAVIATTAVLLVLGHSLFFPPAVQTGLADLVLGSFRQTFAAPLVQAARLLV